MSNKNRKTTNVKSSILILLLIAVLLIASTYAWFTSNRTVTISQIDVNVAAASGLQISVDGISWKAQIINADITGASSTYEDAVNQLPASMAPVSSIGDIVGNRMKVFFGNVEANPNNNNAYELTASQEADANGTTGRYVAFDIFLKLDDATSKPIYLTANSDVTANGTDKGIKNASRVALCVLGHTASTSNAATIQGLTGGAGLTPATPYSVIWEPNYDVHTQQGVYNAQSVYGVTTSLTGGSKLSYYGVKAPISTGVVLNSTDASYFGQVTTTGTVAAHTDTPEILTLEPGITKVRVYMWVEGQDVDC